MVGYRAPLNSYKSPKFTSLGRVSYENDSRVPAQRGSSGHAYIYEPVARRDFARLKIHSLLDVIDIVFLNLQY